MKERIKKYWKDPVLSKIIAFGLIGILTIIYNLTKSYFNKTEFTIEFNKFWKFEIELWVVIITLLILYILHLTFKLSKKSRKTFVYDHDTLVLDKELFEKFRTELITNDVINNLKTHTFSVCPFDMNDIDFIHEILELDRNPNFEFINPDLEALKNDLLESTNKLQEALFNNIFGTDIKHPEINFIGIPKEWKGEQFKKARTQIEIAEDLMFLNSERLIKKGRRVLKV